MPARTTAFQTIRYEVREHIATITLNRPRVRNAQNSALILELDRAMRRAAADPSVRVIILAAAGPAFSAGHDLKAVVGQEAPDAWRRLRSTPEGRLRHERELGQRQAKEFLFLGDPIDAREAWRLGLVNRVVPRQRLAAETRALARRIALIPPVTAALVKES